MADKAAINLHFNRARAELEKLQVALEPEYTALPLRVAKLMLELDIVHHDYHILSED